MVLVIASTPKLIPVTRNKARAADDNDGVIIVLNKVTNPTSASTHIVMCKGANLDDLGIKTLPNPVMGK
jgi:hypothetical protein